MKLKMILLLTMVMPVLLTSCQEDETKADPRKEYLGKWQGPCAYNCPGTLEEDRLIEFTIFNGASDDELLLEIEFRFVLNDPNVTAVVENVVAVLTEDGFEIEGQTVAFNTTNIYISGEGTLEKGELKFDLDVPLSIAACDLTGTIPKE